MIALSLVEVKVFCEFYRFIEQFFKIRKSTFGIKIFKNPSKYYVSIRPALMQCLGIEKIHML